MELFGGGLVAGLFDGEVFFVEDGPEAGAFAEVEHFGGQAVGDVYHGGGHDGQRTQFVDDVYAGFGLELAADEVVCFAEIWLHIGVGQIGLLFAGQDLEAEIGCAEVAGDAEDVSFAGGVAVADLFGAGVAEGSDGDDQSTAGRGRIAAYQFDLIMCAGGVDTGVEFFDGFYGEAVAQADAHGHLGWQGVHGGHVGEVDGDGFVAEVFERRERQVKVDAFQQHVGRHDQIFGAAGVEYCRIVADALDGGGVHAGGLSRQSVYEAELANLLDFSSFQDNKTFKTAGSLVKPNVPFDKYTRAFLLSCWLFGAKIFTFA